MLAGVVSESSRWQSEGGFGVGYRSTRFSGLSNAVVSRRWPVDVKARGQGLRAERIPISQDFGSVDSLVCDTVESEPDSVVGLGTARWDGLAAACRH